MGTLLLALFTFSHDAHTTPFIPIDGKEKRIATGRMFDLAIEGEGYFRIRHFNGGFVYTRFGRFYQGPSGNLETREGYTLDPMVTVPPSAGAVTIDPNGQVHTLLPDDKYQLPIGQIALYRFACPSELVPFERGYEAETRKSGEAVMGDPGSRGLGKVRQRSVNTSPVTSFTRMQRGNFQFTGRPFDLAIEGAGFFRVLTPAGENLFTRHGRFHLDDKGHLTTTEGYLLQPQLAIPVNAHTVSFGADGCVTAGVRTDGNEVDYVGDLTICRFPNALALSRVKGAYYKVSTQSGAPCAGRPSSEGGGGLQQCFIERSSYIPHLPEGRLVSTGRCFDLAIEGQGFFAVEKPTGGRLFTRHGRFRVNADGKIETQHGYLLQPQITLRLDAVSVAIDPDGTIRAIVASQAAPVRVGQIILCRFTNPLALTSFGDRYFQASKESGVPASITPSAGGHDKVWQGFIERSPQEQFPPP
ncbi:flagellar hook-basal body protein [Frigoriglobus tundricola]|uniref:Flagellar basal-body rod protein FlgG n=1 Tax=Frigoriglobus tundricola TaxID=2774151 RepID=A0A6M5Z6U1_9BACT|nr:hypothetical protein [Frigoriglobus tundricola]QJX01352.1 Flagellar basal-body rod protein FlgG [Frigoriglobus tundricola]